MSEHATVRGACPVCAGKKIIRCDMDPVSVPEIHQCTSCGARLVAALGMKRALLLATLGVLFCFLTVFGLLVTGGIPGLAPVWQALSFVAVIGVIYNVCAWQIRRGIQYELWVPVNTY